jgi:hypothetical protein
MEANSPIPSIEAASLKQAVRRRRALVDEWKQGTKRQRQLARTMSRCRKRHRCGLLECPVCQRSKSGQLRMRVAGTASAKMPKSARIEKVAVKDLLVLGKRRECNAGRVKELAASIAAIGLRTPITIRRKAGEDRPILVAGLHRLKAATSLGWKVIDAMVMRDKLAARLWAIAENLHRSELTAMERADLVRKWVKLIHKLEVSGHNVRKPKGGRPEGGIAKAARDLPVSGICLVAWPRCAHLQCVCVPSPNTRSGHRKCDSALVAGEDVRTPLGAFRVVFGIEHFNNQPSASVGTPEVSRT